MTVRTTLSRLQNFDFRIRRILCADSARIASTAIPAGLCILMLVAVCACSSAPSLHRDVQHGSYDALLKHLGEGTSTSERDAGGLTPLHAALTTGKPRMALELIHHGADINARTPKGFTPLTMAVRNDYREVVDLLLERNAVIEFESVGPSPLFEAIVANNGELFERLALAGAKIDRRDDAGRTALHYAADFGRLRLAERLLALGADINAALPDGRTPLHSAVGDTGAVKYDVARNPALADLLYERGAAVTAAQDELGGYTTALVYRFAAKKEYAKRDTLRAVEFIQRTQSALLVAQTHLNEQAEIYAKRVNVTTLANIALLILGQASANIQARTSVTGYGSQTVFMGSTASNEQMRDRYRNAANWCGEEAQRLSSLRDCVVDDQHGDRACFSSPSK